MSGGVVNGKENAIHAYLNASWSVSILEIVAITFNTAKPNRIAVLTLRFKYLFRRDCFVLESSVPHSNTVCPCVNACDTSGILLVRERIENVTRKVFRWKKQKSRVVNRQPISGEYSRQSQEGANLWIHVCGTWTYGVIGSHEHVNSENGNHRSLQWTCSGRRYTREPNDKSEKYIFDVTTFTMIHQSTWIVHCHCHTFALGKNFAHFFPILLFHVTRMTSCHRLN